MNNVFKQCGVGFSVVDRGALDIAYDDNTNGVCENLEKNVLPTAHTWEDDIIILLMKMSKLEKNILEMLPSQKSMFSD